MFWDIFKKKKIEDKKETAGDEFSWNSPSEKNIGGALPDNRSQEDKEYDFRSEELFSASYPWTLTWEKDKDAILKSIEKLPQYNQERQYTCVAHAINLLASDMNLKEEGVSWKFSPSFNYPFRSNSPAGGMYMPEAFLWCVKNGFLPMAMLNSEGLSESQMNDKTRVVNSMYQVAKVYKPKAYFTTKLTFDDIADVVVNQKIPVGIGLRFGEEWWAPEPKLTNYVNYGHAVVVVAAFKKNGVNTLLIQDSAGINSCYMGRYRFVTADWQRKIFFSGYFVDLDNNWRDRDYLSNKPKHQLSNVFYYGMVNNAEVRKLQEILTYYETFPKTISWTGNFYGITKKAVADFQIKHNIVLAEGEVLGIPGRNTIAYINNLLTQ